MPEIAARAHLRNLLPVIDEALRQANVTLRDIGCIAVHNTPGLVGALLVGVSAAKMLSLALDVPLIAVNHIASHIYACRLAAERDIFPCVGFVVSGGHTLLFHCDDALTMHLLGGTRDDAAGEAFDKVAAILGLGFPGGPAVEREAAIGNPKAYRVPAIVPPRRPARIQLQRLEDGGALHAARPERRQGRTAAAGQAARRPGRELSASGRRCAGREVPAGAAANGPEAPRRRRRRDGEQDVCDRAGGDGREGRGGVVHPAD